jgi:hypothetical protein
MQSRDCGGIAPEAAYSFQAYARHDRHGTACPFTPVTAADFASSNSTPNSVNRPSGLIEVIQDRCSAANGLR